MTFYKKMDTGSDHNLQLKTSGQFDTHFSLFFHTFANAIGENRA